MALEHKMGREYYVETAQLMQIVSRKLGRPVSRMLQKQANGKLGTEDYTESLIEALETIQHDPIELFHPLVDMLNGNGEDDLATESMRFNIAQERNDIARLALWWTQYNLNMLAGVTQKMRHLEARRKELARSMTPEDREVLGLDEEGNFVPGAR